MVFSCSEMDNIHILQWHCFQKTFIIRPEPCVCSIRKALGGNWGEAGSSSRQKCTWTIDVLDRDFWVVWENSSWSPKEEEKYTYSEKCIQIYMSMLLFSCFRWPLQVQVQPEQEVILHTVNHENNPIITLESLNHKHKHLTVHCKKCMYYQIPKMVRL